MIVQVPSSLTTIMKMIIIDYPTSSDHDEDEDDVNDENDDDDDNDDEDRICSGATQRL